ncbi:NACHT domain-containing protein [Streptomyces spongiae]|uniref:NACHT domain-containing protein n=1 Tax=Streptomyces spongiae TaxID=565072 RepID=A0A5N8XVP1_9ACTN|nr:NACHT domain-containing protein [Streptomyces spongiae]MPY63128.1 NACHT domain-containing protein [Streptomyces spongiae]
MADVSLADDESPEPRVHNEVNGAVHGTVIQSGRTGRVTVNNYYTSPARTPEDERDDRDDRDELAEAADELADAVRDRWQREEKRRRLTDPILLPVRWTTAAGNPMDHWENICGTPRGRTAAPLALDGDLEHIAGTYRKIPSGRLVVLGEAGSGKTVLGLRLVLELLETRPPGAPVPEIFSLGSWDPRADSLENWLSSRLSRDTSGLATVTADGRTLATALVEKELILPVLDGFDEIADKLRAAALEQLSETTMPLVLTSRTAQYRSAVRNTRGLKRAAAVELTALGPDDAKDYLVRGSSRDVTRAWEDVLAKLRDSPDDPAGANLRDVLATPLMVALALAVHGEGAEAGSDSDSGSGDDSKEAESQGAESQDAESQGAGPKRGPETLLDTRLFRTRDDLEKHLLSSFIPSVYRRRPGDRHTAASPAWSPEQAQRWLGYLADHLRQRHRPDLEWWKLGTSMSLGARTAVISFLAGLSFMLTTAIGTIPVDLIATSHGLGFAIRRGVVVGVLHGLVGGVAFGYIYRLADRSDLLKPSPVRVRLFGGPRQLGARFSAKVVTGSLVAFGVALAILLVDRLVVPPLGLDDGLGGGLLSAVVFPLEIGLGAGLALGLMAWLETPIDVKTSVSCADLLRSNRTNVIAHLLVWAFALGLVAGLVGSFTETPLRSLQLGLAFGIQGAFAAGIGYGLSLTAWCQWVALVRIWLPLTGRLPWRLVAFLEDACERGALRRAGAVYQFRHARLQDHLSGTLGE